MALNNEGVNHETVLSKLKQSNGNINVSDLARYIDSDLKTVFMEREKFALINMLDVNKKGEIDSKFIEKELRRATVIGSDPTQPKIVLDMEQKRDLKQPKKVDLLVSKTTAELPDPTRPVAPGGVRPAPAGPQPQEGGNLASIMKKIQGCTTISAFLLTALEKCWCSDGKMKLPDFQKYIEGSYSNILTPKEIALLIRSMDSNLDQKIDLVEFREVLLS
jgi:Ca2+-binding EF-hand superfamily protein